MQLVICVLYGPHIYFSEFRLDMATQAYVRSQPFFKQVAKSTMKNIRFPTVVETTVESLSCDLNTWKYTLSRPPTLMRVYLDAKREAGL